MGKSKKDDRMTFVQNFVSGGIAGVTSRTITSPLDVVKILAQVGTQDTKSGFLKTFSNVYTNEGLRAFWKGNGIACIRLFPYSAVQFAAFNKLKVMLADKETGQLSALRAMFAGSMGGISATIMTYPTDMVKTRLTAQHASKDKAHYGGIVDAFRSIFRDEGFFAFYKGMSTSIIGVIPFAGGTFMAYEVLDRAWGKPKWEMTPMENFINGCLAAAFAQTFSFPFDTIRKKLQAQSKVLAGGGGVDVEFTGMSDAFIQTVRKNGILGLWSGTVANLAKVAPYAGLMFMSFEASKRICLYWNGYTSSPWRDSPIAGIDQGMKPHELKEFLAKQKGN